MVKGALVVGLLALAAPVQAGPLHLLRNLIRGGHAAPNAVKLPKPGRVHLLDRVFSRLNPETQQNAYSLVHYAGERGTGSGIVVGAWTGKKPGTLRALVLTNEHVTHDNHKHAALTFLDGSQVTSSRVVAKSKLLDYTLVEVVLPGHANIVAAAPDKELPPLGQKVYALGAATSMTSYPLKSFLGGGLKARMKVYTDERKGFDDQNTISSGKVFAGPTVVRVQGERKLVIDYDAAAAPGSSGGPVFDTHSQRVVGLHANGYRDDQISASGMIPMGYILYDLGKKFQRGKIAKASQDTVGDLLGQVYPAEAPAGAR
jgi:S1-C subfamily serine protease